MLLRKGWFVVSCSSITIRVKVFFTKIGKMWDKTVFRFKMISGASETKVELVWGQKYYQQIKGSSS